MHTIPVSDDARDLLRRSTITSDLLKFPPGQLARPLYEEVNKALVALGGKWNRGAGGHRFSSDPRAAVAAIVGGEVLVDKKKTLQAFFTPDKLADQVVSHADLRPGSRTLEPSAGDGQLVRAARRAEDGIFIHAVEINPDYQKALAAAANLVSFQDFLKATPQTLGMFDRVVMNPPFTKGQDAEHIVHAFGFLRPGGVLAAIASRAHRFHKEKKYQGLRDLIDEYGEADIDVDAGAFKESGTNVATAILVLRK